MVGFCYQSCTNPNSLKYVSFRLYRGQKEVVNHTYTHRHFSKNGKFVFRGSQKKFHDHSTFPYRGLKNAFVNKNTSGKCYKIIYYKYVKNQRI
jgi:hypothetical protein